MATVHIELPPHSGQIRQNLSRWAEVSSDPELARFEGRIETDRHGHVVMTPPPSPRHGALQSEIAYLLRSAQSAGRVITECPLSTSDGVKAADVAWASAERISELGDAACFPRAPEILVEVLSPGNSEAEVLEKKALYFDAGAREVWLCDESGRVTFYGPTGVCEASALFPNFPGRIDLP